MDVDVELQFAIDRKLISQRFCCATLTPTCFYRNNIHDFLIKQGQCVVHKESCEIPTSPHCAISGASCHPYTAMREKKAKVLPGKTSRKGPAETHPDYNAIHEDLVCYYEQYTPDGGILEETRGFLKPDRQGRSSGERFAEALYEQGYIVSYFELGIGKFQEGSRDRVYGIILGSKLGYWEGMAEIRSIVEDTWTYSIMCAVYID
jgi:hypothetical protein